jgi:two-component system, chemotaxis family, protein-glutamate methylesterase/glutaminase
MGARDIIAIGASAGGLEAVQKVAAGFPADLKAAVFVTLHVHGKGDGFLPARLNRSCTLPAANAIDEEPIRSGRIYVAPPDHHLVLGADRVYLVHGPKENLQRPCINVMFRSAAAVFGERVSGVLLTGLLDDGAAGLWEIQQHGGATIAQDPDEATFRSMPESAICGLNVQYIVRLAEMGPLLTRLAMEDHKFSSSERESGQVDFSRQTCPECGGAMTTVRMGGLREYRCHIGHRFGLRTMIAEKTRVVERATEVALAQSEELTDLLERALANADVEDLPQLKDQIAQRKREQETLRAMSGNERTAPAER